MTSREATARGIAFLLFRLHWRVSQIRDYCEIPAKDVLQIAYEGRALVLHDLAASQARQLCGRQLKRF